MIKLIIICLIVVGLVLSAPFAYQEYTIWDATNPEDDDSRFNELLLAFTPKINALDVSASLDANLGVPVIDTRSVEEYDAGHIPGAILIPEPRLYEEFPKKYPEKNIRVFVYGSNDQQSAAASRLLRNMGYVSLYIIDGLRGWQKVGLKTEKTNSMYF